MPILLPHIGRSAPIYLVLHQFLLLTIFDFYSDKPLCRVTKRIYQAASCGDVKRIHNLQRKMRRMWITLARNGRT